MFTNAQETSAYHLEALSELHTMDRMRVRVLVALRARFSRHCSAVRDGVGPVHVVKTHVSCSRNARTLCKSEYAMSLLHHMRPLNRRETHRFRDFRKPRFRLGAVSDRARESRYRYGIDHGSALCQPS